MQQSAAPRRLVVLFDRHKTMLDVESFKARAREHLARLRYSFERELPELVDLGGEA